MKIIFVLPILSYRGAERVALNAATALKKLNVYSILFFLTQDTHIPTDNTIKKAKSNFQFPQARIKQLLMNKYLFLLCSPAITFFYMIRHLRKEKYDIIQTESYPCNFGAFPAAKLFGKPIIWIVHDIAAKPNMSKNPLLTLINLFLFNLDSIVGARVNHIIVVSPKTYSKVKSRFPQIQTTLLIPPINQSRLNISRKYTPPQQATLLIIGALHPLKNQKLGIEIVATLQKKFPNIRLICVGAGDSKPLYAAAKQLGLSIATSIENQASIIIPGFVADDQIGYYYQLATITLITSCDEGEGLGITGFESYYKQRPCIATRDSGISEIFHSENFGFSCLPNPQAFSKTIEFLLNNPEKYKDDVNRGYSYVTQNLTQENYAEGLYKIYQQVINH